MSRPTLPFLSLCLLTGWLFSTSAQVVTTEPAKPKWGDTLKIIYNPQASGAKFTLEQAVQVIVYQSVIGQNRPKEQKLTMTKAGTVLTAEVIVEPDTTNLQLLFMHPPNEMDSRNRAMLMVYRTDGQPARGAWLTQARGKDYLTAVANELALYPDNYGAYLVKWQAAGFLDAAKVKDMIEADIKEVSSKLTDEPASWLRALVLGHLLLKQEEPSRMALRKLVEKSSDSALLENALGDYLYQSMSLRLAGDGPKEVDQMVFAAMKRKPASSFSREYIGWFTSKKDTPLDLIETICRKWIEDRPQDANPYLHLAKAYEAHDRKAEDIAPVIDKAIELYLADSSKSSEFYLSSLPDAFRLSAEAAFKLKRYSQAVTAIKTAQALARETNDAVYLLEARIWEQVKQPSLAEKAYRVAWKLGSKPAEESLRAMFQKDKGTLTGFEAWLNKEDNALAKRAFPAFNLTALDGKSYDLTALRGKVVVLNFWFIGCGPCKAEMPDLNQLVKDNTGKDVVFLAPALDDAESLRAFLKQNQFDYQVIAAAGTFAEQQGVQAYPAHFVINQKGEVELTLRGAGEKNVTQIRNVLARLLSASK